MNDVFTLPLTLLANAETAPRAREWHAMHQGDVAILVVDFADDGARRAFAAQPGAIAWPDPYVSDPVPADAVPGGLGKAIGQQVSDRAPDVLAKLRRVWPMARYHFD